MVKNAHTFRAGSTSRNFYDHVDSADIPASIQKILNNDCWVAGDIYQVPNHDKPYTVSTIDVREAADVSISHLSSDDVVGDGDWTYAILEVTYPHNSFWTGKPDPQDKIFTTEKRDALIYPPAKPYVPHPLPQPVLQPMKFALLR